MSDLNWDEGMDEEDEVQEKIPFDLEPIERRPSREYKKQVRKKTQPLDKSFRAWFYVFMAGVMCVCGVMAFKLVSVNRQVEKMKGERSSYLMNISATDGDVSYATAKGMLSTVSISASYADNCTSAETFFGSGMASRGSGVILEVNKNTGDAYIMTNYHVVCNVNTRNAITYQWVLLWDSINPVRATYVGGSYNYDVAVLKISASEEIKNSTCVSATIGTADNVCLGESVVAIGNSMARNLRVSSGRVAVEEELMGSAPYNMYISHSADVNSGNSGGGLYNSRGELIGIVNAKFKDVSDFDGSLIYNEVIHGMNYAIPANLAESIARNIIRNGGTLLRPSLWLTLGTNVSYTGKNYQITDTGMGYTTYDLVVESATGKFWRNDKLISVTYEYNGRTITAPLNRLFTLACHNFNLDQGSQVKVRVERSGAEKDLTITIDSVTSVS